MRQGQQNRRGRGRSNSNSSSNNSNHNSGRKQQNSLARNYESNGPDVKIRGSATQIAEKYMTLARDASSAGDIVMAENYLQHAEHYNRIIMASQAQNQAQTQAQPQIQQPTIEQPEQDKADTPATQDRRTSSETNGAMPEQPQPEISSANVGEQPVIVPVEAEKDQPAPSGEEEAQQPARRRRRRYPGSASSRANASGVENATGHANGADITSEARPSTEAIV